MSGTVWGLADTAMNNQVPALKELTFSRRRGSQQVNKNFCWLEEPGRKAKRKEGERGVVLGEGKMCSGKASLKKEHLNKGLKNKEDPHLTSLGKNCKRRK